MTRRYAAPNGEPLEAMSIRFTASNKAALTTASALLDLSVNAIVNHAVEDYLVKPEVVSAMRDEQSRYQATIDRLAGDAP